MMQKWRRIKTEFLGKPAIRFATAAFALMLAFPVIPLGCIYAKGCHGERIAEKNFENYESDFESVTCYNDYSADGMIDCKYVKNGIHYNDVRCAKSWLNPKTCEKVN